MFPPFTPCVLATPVPAPPAPIIIESVKFAVLVTLGENGPLATTEASPLLVIIRAFELLSTIVGD